MLWRMCAGSPVTRIGSMAFFAHPQPATNVSASNVFCRPKWPALTAPTPCESPSLDLGRHLFAEDLHLVDQLLHRVGREVEAQQMGDAGLAEGVGLVDDLGRRADQVDVLVGSRALALQGRFAERY